VEEREEAERWEENKHDVNTALKNQTHTHTHVLHPNIPLKHINHSPCIFTHMHTWCKRFFIPVPYSAPNPQLDLYSFSLFDPAATRSIVLYAFFFTCMIILSLLPSCSPPHRHSFLRFVHVDIIIPPFPFSTTVTAPCRSRGYFNVCAPSLAMAESRCAGRDCDSRNTLCRLVVQYGLLGQQKPKRTYKKHCNIIHELNTRK